MGYTETSKREELFDDCTRFLLCLELRNGEEPCMPGALQTGRAMADGKSQGKGKGRESVELEDGRELVSYCSFRFDTEETLGSRDAEVLYWYVQALLHLTTGLEGVVEVYLS